MLQQTMLQMGMLLLLLLWYPASYRVTSCTVDTIHGLTDHDTPEHEHSKQLTRRGTRDRMLVFTSIIEPPFLQRSPQSEMDADNTLGAFQGFIPDLISKIARKLRQPFAIKLVNPGQGGYGVDAGNGYWNGIIGEVARGEADVATGALTIRADRQEVVDFTRPFMTAGIAGVLKRSPGGVHLTATSPLELADRKDLHFGLIPGSLIYHYFRTSNETNARKIWHRITTENPPFYEWSSIAGIERVRNSSGDFVFLVESVFAEYQITKPPCNLVILEKLVNLSEYAFAVTKDSPLKERIDSALEYLEQNGSIQKLRDKWWDKTCVRRKDKKKNPRTQEVLKTSPFTVKQTSSTPLWLGINSTPMTLTNVTQTEPSTTTTNLVTHTTALPSKGVTSAQTTKEPYHPRKGASFPSDVTTWRPCLYLLGLSLLGQILIG